MRLPIVSSSTPPQTYQPRLAGGNNVFRARPPGPPEISPSPAG